MTHPTRGAAYVQAPAGPSALRAGHLGNRALEDFLRRRHFERSIIELKRQRRQETLMSWRDVLFLKRESQAIHRELDSLGKTAGYAQKPKANR